MAVSRKVNEFGEPVSGANSGGRALFAVANAVARRYRSLFSFGVMNPLASKSVYGEQMVAAVSSTALSLSICFVYVALSASISAAPFENLDFEQANTNSLTYDAERGVTVGKIGDLMPGWQVITSDTLLAATNSLSSIPFNSDASIALTDQDPLDPRIPKSGSYSLSLTSPTTEIILIQRGDVPDWATGVHITGPIIGTLPVFVVPKLNGIPLPLESPNFVISEFAGKNAELSVTFPVGSYHARIDSIEFVPEPSSILLTTVGFGLLLARLGWAKVQKPRCARIT